MFPLVLAAILVGLAIVRSLSTFQETQRLRTETQIHETLYDAAERAQMWYRRPAALGGGNRSFANLSWRNINVNPHTSLANFTMTEKRQSSVRLTGTSVDSPAMIISYVVYPDSVVLQPAHKGDRQTPK